MSRPFLILFLLCQFGLGAVSDALAAASWFNAPTPEETQVQNFLAGFVNFATLGAANLVSSAVSGTDLTGNHLDFEDAFQQTLQSGAFVASLALTLPTGGASLEAEAAFEGGLGAAAKATSTELSVIRYTQPGETFLRYESTTFTTRITSSGGVTPQTFAAPVSDGLIPLAERSGTYNLFSPNVLRTEAFTLKPPPGTAIIGPRSVVGGSGNEVIFPFGF